MANGTWHSVSLKESLHELHASRAGLTSREAATRARRYGYNELGTIRTRTPWQLFFSQFTSPLTYILFVGTAVAGYSGELLDAAIILAVLLLNAIIGYVQESRAEAGLASIQSYFSPKAAALRNGTLRSIPARELVPGDVVEIREGANVPADLRLIQAVQLFADESPLTGESAPVEKSTGTVAHDTPLGRRTNLLLAGTHVVSGHGLGVVTGTGGDTEFGKLVAATAVLESATPLTVQLTQLGKYSLVGVGIVCGIVAVVGIMQQREPLSLLLTLVATAVAAVPEGLPVFVTVSLALGVRTLTRQRVAVRQLASLETLGQIDTIVSDKTGTLTHQELSVERLYLPDGTRLAVAQDAARKLRGTDRDAAVTIATTSILASNADGRQSDGKSDDQTELALLGLGEALELDATELRGSFKRRKEIPFSPALRFMATLHDTGQPGRYRIAAKGSVATMLARCTAAADGARVHALTEKRRNELVALATDIAKEGYRVLAIAGADTRRNELPRSVGGLTLLGFAAMLDAPRPEAQAAIGAAAHDGIRIVMATGDSAATSTTVARQLGILPARGATALTGTDVAAMTDAELGQAVAKHAVFAEVSPDLKLRVLQALKDRGSMVAVLGDGANDAPILKSADIGIAMGNGATELAQNVADMVLLDNNFATLPSAIAEGRRVLGTLRRVVWYLACTNASELLLLAAALLAGLPLPLLPTQILWINIVTDGIAVSGLLSEPLHHKHDGTGQFLLTGALAKRALWTAVAMTGLLWWIFAITLRTTGSVDTARSATFLGIAALQLLTLAMSRSLTKPIRILSWSKNPRLLWLILASFAVTAAIIYVPALQRLFHTVAVGPGQLGMIGISFILLAGFLEGQSALAGRRRR